MERRILPTIRLGLVVAPGSTAALLMMKPDASVHRNVTYKFKPMHFVSTAVELAPFASNQVDIIDMSYAAIGAAIENAHLTDLRIVADEIQNGIYGHENGSGFLVLKDGPIKSLRRFEGQGRRGADDRQRHRHASAHHDAPPRARG